MKYEGLLTESQKRAGYFVTQDQDFVYLWWGRNSSPNIIAIFLYDRVRLKEIRDQAEKHRQEMPDG